MPPRRKYHRFHFNGEVDIRARGEREKMLKGYLSDISLGGMGIFCREPIAVDENVFFALTVPLSQNSLSGNGVIRHATLKENYGNELFYIGVQFKGVPQNKIKELLKDDYIIDKDPLLSEQRRREIRLLAKLLLPFLAVIVWLLIAARK
ncbi:MAG: PilZ domain-containing protein [Candidatus Omnitrophica bacterium]|nr:PilZ domain-containing protein [Candidatus Omnitrophota bacterium]